MKKVIFTFLIIILFANTNILSVRASNTFPGSIKCVVSNDSFSEVDRILYSALKRLKVEMTIDINGEENGIKMTQNGERCMTAALPAGLEEDYPELLMIAEPIGSVTYAAYGKKDSNITLNSWDSLSGMRVGTLFQKYFIDKSLPSQSTQIKMSNTDELKAALNAGLIDVIVTSTQWEDNIIVSDKFKTLGIIETTKTYAYINKDFEDLKNAIQDTLKIMKIDGTIERITNHEDDSDIKNVLLITSYYDDMEWDQKIKTGVNEVFEDDENSLLYTVSLNANRVLDADSRAITAQGVIRTIFSDKKPDIIIVSDNSALDFVSEYYKILFDDTPVVFCGINGYPSETIQQLSGRSTGLLENVSADETVDRMLKIFPNTKNIFVLNDFTETGIAIRNDIQSQLTRYSKTLNIEYNEPLSLEDLCAQLSTLSSDTLVLVGRINIDGNGKYYKISEMQRAMAAASSVPMFGLIDAFYGYGQLGGKYAAGEVHGKYAAQMAYNILNGEDVASMPIRLDTGTFNRWIFDREVMQKYSITDDKLPAGTEIINLEEVVYTFDTPTIYLLISALVALLIILILFLFYILQLRKQNDELKSMKEINTMHEIMNKEAEILAVKDQLEKTINSAPLVYMLIIDRVIVETNEYFDERIDLKKGVQFTADEMNFTIIKTITDKKASEKTVYGRILELPMINGNKHRFHLNIVNTKMDDRNAIIAWGIDIEESERQKDNLKHTKHDLQKLLDLIPTSISVRDLTGKSTIYVNKAMVKVFGCKSKAEFIGLSMDRFYPEFQPDGNESKASNLSIMKRFLESQEPVTFEWIYSIPDKPPLYAQVSYSTILYDNELSLLSIIQDISTEKLRTQLLTEAAEKEREANNLKSRFLMNMSHEMRTPMNAIIGLSQIALKKNQTPANMDTYKKINTSAKNLLTIINDILDFSKIEAERLLLVNEEFLLEDILSNAIMMAGERIMDKKIHMHLDIEQDVPYILIGDRTRTWQVVKNLLDNSAKFTDTGSITLGISIADSYPETVTVPDRHTVLKFVVEDTGCGMTESQLNKLFTPFEQFSTRSDQVTSGTGLGMSISRQIVHAMLGEIFVQSELKKGTKTTVYIPFKLPYEIITMAQYTIPVMNDKKHVLIYDSDEVSLGIIKKLLSFASIEAVYAKDNADTVELEKTSHLADKQDELFNSVIVDNIETAKIIYNNNPNTGILLITDINDKSMSNDNKSRYISDCIERPFIPTVFYQKLFNLDIESKVSADSFNLFDNAQVLVCEDNLFNQEVASEMLQVFGITPIIVNNGSEAIDILNKKSFDMIFMDLQMPVMDGYEATMEIRNGDYPYSNIPIVAMTANVGNDEKQRCLNVGMNDHIPKPLDLALINKALLQFIPSEKLVQQQVQNENLNVPVIVSNDSVELNKNTETVPESPMMYQTSTDDNIMKLSSIGIDVDTGIKRFGGKTEKYLKLLHKFASSMTDDLVAYEDMFPDNDNESAKKKIHTLKGTAGNLSITKVYDGFVEFEQLLRLNTQTPYAYEQLIQICSAAKNDILTILHNI